MDTEGGSEAVWEGNVEGDKEGELEVDGEGEDCPREAPGNRQRNHMTRSCKYLIVLCCLWIYKP